jgi:hypothetical protein
LAYLAAFHRYSDSTVAPEDLMDAMRSAQAAPFAGRHAIRESDRLEYLLRATLQHLAVEGMNLPGALAAVAGQCGVLILPNSTVDGDAIRTSWTVVAPGSAPPRELMLARGGRDENGAPRYDVSTRSDLDVLSDNNVADGRFEWTGTRIDDVRVIGNPERHLVTVPLRPGWLPTAGLDDVDAEDRPAAKALALTPAQLLSYSGDPQTHDWFRRFHAAGAEFEAHAGVGRHWVLNENGEQDDAYTRNPPFDDAAPFRFDTVLASDIALAQFATLRPRRLLPRGLVDDAIRPGGVLVEISFDSGVTWFALSRGYAVLNRQCGIRLTVDNLLSVTPPNAAPESRNLWYALIDQTFRIRASAMMEGDTRLMARSRSPLHEGGHAPAQWIDLGPRYGHAHDSSFIPPFQCTALETIARDHADLAPSAARATPRIPWIDVAYRIGDAIDLVRGRDWPMDDSTWIQRARPVVLGITWRFTARGFGTHLAIGPVPLTPPGDAVGATKRDACPDGMQTSDAPAWQGELSWSD